MRAAHVLIVEDEGLVAEEISLHVRRMGHTVSAVVDNAPDAFECARTVHPDMALHLIRQVWVNLLANAVKFTRAAAEPRVRVTGAVEARAACYFVEDNGIGFDPAHASKLFRVFERLHTQQEFEGNGVGLCIVQRIVHRHEGGISLSGKPGEGARVKFWLPRAEKNGRC